MNKTHQEKLKELLDKMAENYMPIMPHTLPVFECLTQHIKQRNLIEFLDRYKIEYPLLFHFSRIAYDTNITNQELYTIIDHGDGIQEHTGRLATIILGYKFKNCLRENRYYFGNEKRTNKYFTVYYNKKLFLVKSFNYWVIEDISTIAKNDLKLEDQKEVERILTDSGFITYTVEQYKKKFNIGINFSRRNTDR